MNRLPRDRQIQIVSALCNGMGIRAIERTFDVNRRTVLKLLVDAGTHCKRLQDDFLADLDCSNVQIDEIWTFCGKKQGKLKGPERQKLSLGDQYLYYAVDRETKIVAAWHVGKRDMPNTVAFLGKLQPRLGVDLSVSTDSFNPYRYTVPAMLGRDREKFGYGQVTKNYNVEQVGRGRYAPPRVTGVTKKRMCGMIHQKDMCTSHVERANLTLRTFQRRFTRLALGFSKKLDNLNHAVALHFAYYNFCWVPRTQKHTPAMMAGITPRRWTVEDLVPEF